MDEKTKGPFDPEGPDEEEPFLKVTERGDPSQEPFFNLPGGITVILVVLLIIYSGTGWFLSDEISEWIMSEFGFSPLRYVYSFADQDFAWLWTPVTYSLLHGSIEHLGFNALWLAAFGTPVWRRIGAFRFAIFWVVTAVASAFFHAALNWGDSSLLIGASGVISGLMGACCRFVFGPGRMGLMLRDTGELAPRFSILAALQQKTVIVFIVMFVFANAIIAFGVTLAGDPGAPIAWDAHLGGFLVGFLGFGLFDPVRGKALETQS
ncbi:rhomboid family intramembrane serine protease [Allorhizobium sp. BGMRC 0089]|uniref:rhomboid family intramembrane serine protease n=1 Tax=Allorhizobium sonneratiae TaxID=2934936 RepID=UPI0020339F66|nr:rhomboid family intramembrane serine protease [Allorhizobium sonneratiae]MCM2292215.1 rhomboid family intramembrane serine protease [Allorhizobium sonneratiae]